MDTENKVGPGVMYDMMREYRDAYKSKILKEIEQEINSARENGASEDYCNGLIQALKTIDSPDEN